VTVLVAVVEVIVEVEVVVLDTKKVKN